jgi:hypothetical protein
MITPSCEISFKSSYKSLASFIMQSRPTRQSMLVEPRTPLKTNKSSILLNRLVFNNGQDFQERCLTEAQALPYDDYEAHGGEVEQQQQTNIWKIDRFELWEYCIMSYIGNLQKGVKVFKDKEVV